jgi:hypothetical protein
MVSLKARHGRKSRANAGVISKTRKWAIKAAETAHLLVELTASLRNIAATNRFEFESTTADD